MKQPFYSLFSTTDRSALPSEPHLLKQAIEIAQEFKYDWSRASGLRLIASQLPSSEPHLLEQVLEIAKSITDGAASVYALGMLVPQLSSSERLVVLEQTFKAARSISSDKDRPFALMSVLDAPQLSSVEREIVLEHALEAAQAVTDDESRAKALLGIAPDLLSSAPHLLENVLEAVRSISDARFHALALAEIIPHFPPLKRPAILRQALDIAQTIEDKGFCALSLAKIVLQLPSSERSAILKQALDIAQTIPGEDEESRALSLVKIALQLSPSVPHLLEQALEAARDIEYEPIRASVLLAIAPHLSPSTPHLLDQILRVASQEIKDGAVRTQALCAIIPRLEPSKRSTILDQALKIDRSASDKWQCTLALSSIADLLPPSEGSTFLFQALKSAESLPDEFRALALRAIAPRLPCSNSPLLEQALKVARSITDIDKIHRTLALREIVPRLPSSEPRLLEQALEAAQEISVDLFRAWTLSAIAPQLPQTHLPQLLRATSGLPKENAAEVLTSPAIRLTEALAVQFPSDKHSVALEVVKALPQDADKTKFLSALVPRLSLGLLPDALRLIQDAFTQDAYRAEAFSNLSPYLPTEQLPEALRLITQCIKTPRHQTKALENLIPFLSFQGFQAVLNLLEENDTEPSNDTPTPELQTKVITEPTLKARILRSVATALSAAPIDAGLSQPPSSAASEGVFTLQIQTDVERSVLIERIFHLTKQLKTHQQKNFSYEKAATDILSHLAPALTQIKNISVSIPQFTDLGYQAQVLSALLPYFPESPESFLNTCSGDDYRALLNIKVQAALLNKFHIQAQNSSNPEERDELLKKQDELDTILKTIEGPYRKAEALVEIARYPVGASYQTEALGTIRGLSNSYLKAQYFQDLIPHLLDRQRLEAADIIREILDPYYRVKAFVALSCKFPEFRGEAKTAAQTLEFRGEAKTAAQTLENCIRRIEQLSNLSVEVPEILPEILDMAEHVKEAIERPQILVALAIHLPMRINREVDRERFAGRPISDDLWERALYLLARGYRDALQGGSLRNESAQDKDFLNLQDEVNSLSDLLLMRDLEPPMTVGILGGWGGGKSYIMHLMQIHMTEVRSRPIAETETWNSDPKSEKLSPYVGHIYQIRFDAWTFAKSDLWASLMQTIFFELDRQLTLETQITGVLNGIEDPGKRRDLESKIWAVLYKTSDIDRQWFLERVLTDKALLDQLSQHNQAETTGQLWKTLNSSQQEAIEQLKKTQQQLEIARRELDTQKAAIRKEINDQFAPLLKINDLKQKQGFKRVDALLGTSFILLRQRIGSQLFKHFQNQICQKLYENSGNTPESDKQPVGLWQELSNTLESLEKAKKELAELNAKESPLSQESAASSTPLSNTALSDNTKTSLAQSSDRVTEKPELTQKEIQKRKEEVQKGIEELFQKTEGLKLDIQTVAANVIEQQYWKVNWNSGWQWVKRNWLLLLLFLSFFISPLLLWKFFQINPIAIGTATVEQILTRIAAILAPTLPALVTLQSLLRGSHKWFEETQLALHEYEKSVENRNKQVEIRIETTIQERLQKNDELQQLERNVRQLETQVEQQKHALPVNEYASLNDFVSDRLSSKTYANRLGLMQQVKEDLLDLSNKLLPPTGQSLESKIKFLKATFPRGPARVVVYIDDLDRCPPDRVVQVLEAVQLLVKTPLFIAVLAIDERYITRALEKFYEGVLSRRGRPSGTDYLEKIIQLPYRVRPIMANTLESYLRSQVVIQDSATGGAKFSEFSRQEFNMLLACCQQVDLSPRTLKRLTNVYKLFKIVCRTRGTKPNLQVQQSILALLALSGRYPSLMRGIFDSIETCFEEQRTLEKVEKYSQKAEKTLRTLHLRSPLCNFFKYYQLPEGDRYLQREFDKLMHDALQTAILPSVLTLNDMTHEIFNLIRSFSFVGEIGEDPEDYRISEATVDDPSLGASIPPDPKNNE